jgi:Mce-associated membrane protein
MALVLALLAGGAGLLLHTQRLSGAPALHNRALSDAEATSRVVAEVGGVLTRVFSYGPQDTAVTRQTAHRFLGGNAARQYQTLFGQVEQRAAQQKLTLTTHVVRAGVTRLDDHDAHLLVFLDQVAQRAGKPATTVAAQLSVVAEQRDGRWRIVDIRSR